MQQNFIQFNQSTSTAKFFFHNMYRATMKKCTIISCHTTYLYLYTFLYIRFIKGKYRSLTIGSLVFIE